jgi:hypothetical protein
MPSSRRSEGVGALASLRDPKSALGYFNGELQGQHGGTGPAVALPAMAAKDNIIAARRVIFLSIWRNSWNFSCNYRR